MSRSARPSANTIIDFQNTQFKLAECKTEATVAKVFCKHCIELHLEGKLDAGPPRWPSYWVSELQCKIVDECLQLHGGYGYMNEYPIARMYADSRVQRIYGGTNEIMKLLIALKSLSGPRHRGYQGVHHMTDCYIYDPCARRAAGQEGRRAARGDRAGARDPGAEALRDRNDLDTQGR